MPEEAYLMGFFRACLMSMNPHSQSACHRRSGQPSRAKASPVPTFNVNGRIHDFNTLADTPLLWALHEHVGFAGTKYGCGVPQCGACLVYLNGNRVRSCSLPLAVVQPLA